MKVRARPSQRTVVVAFLALLAATAIILVATSTVSSVSTNAKTIVERDAPVSSALDDAVTAGMGAQASFLDILGASGEQERNAAVTASTDASQGESSAWQRYLHLARNSPAERVLQSTYQTANTRAQNLGATLVGSGQSSDGYAANLVAQRQASTTAIEALRQIRRQFYARDTSRHASAVVTAAARFHHDVTIAAIIAGIFMLVITTWLVRNTRRDERQVARDNHRRDVQVRRTDLETRLQRALEMEHNEDGTFDVVNQAVRIVAGEHPTELLVADSSRAHFRQVLSTATVDTHSCRVGAPDQCPAASSGQTRTWHSSGELDTCPYLRDQPEPVWATCVPVSIAGRTTGILHAQDSTLAPAPEDLPAELELVARKAGDRIGVMRLLARTQAQADADPLTGLPNRRTLEDRAHSLLQADTPFVVAYLDLDHFKNLNDRHGHDTGDRALRLFARVLRDGIRPVDLPARYGGEEFVVVLPDCSTTDAQAVADRIRANLAEQLAAGTVPAFTVSVGLAAAHPAESLSEVIERADAALLQAKALGRDRTVTIQEHPVEQARVLSDALIATRGPTGGNTPDDG